MSPPRPAQRSTDPVPVLGKVQFSRSQEQGRTGRVVFFFYFKTGLGQEVAKISDSGTGIRRILKAQVNGFQAIELRRLLTAPVPSRSDFWINN